MDHRRKRPAGYGPLERRVRHTAAGATALPDARARQRGELAEAYATAYTQASGNAQRATTNRAPCQNAKRAPAAEGRTAHADRSKASVASLKVCEALSDMHGGACTAVGLT
jgi:hypothetical protein